MGLARSGDGGLIGQNHGLGSGSESGSGSRSLVVYFDQFINSVSGRPGSFFRHRPLVFRCSCQCNRFSSPRPCWPIPLLLNLSFFTTSARAMVV